MKRFCMEPFWDLQLSWNSTNPDFWLCLEESVLVTLPHPLFCILAFYEFYKIYRSERKPLPWTVINFFKIFLTLTLCLITFVDELSIIYLYTTEQYSEYPVYFYTGLVKLVTFILVLIVQWYQRKKGICTSGVLFMFWLFLTIGCTLNFITVVQMVFNDEQRSSISVEYYVVKALSLPIIFSQFLLSCFSDKVLPDLSRRGPTKSCPETTSSFLSQITFSWFTSMARLGKKKPLGQKDMWDLDNDKKTIEILKQFEKQWSKQAQKMATKQQAIFVSMLKAFAPELLIAAFCNFMSASFQLVNPIILDYLITFVSSDDPMWIGYCYAVALLVASALDSLFNAQHEALVNTVAMKMRSCIIATVYKKSLKVSTADQKNFTAGEIVNMMSVDTQKVFDFMQRINILWSAPYQISVCIYLLWQQLGVSTLAGLGVMILILPVSGYLTTRVRMYQIDVMKQKDKRSKLMDEILNGIKVIKLFSWEEFFQDLVMNIRNMEAKYLRKMCFVWGGIFFGFASLPFLVSLASFATFVLIDPKNVLDANKAFVSLSLFNLLRLPVNFLPTAVSFLAMAIISIKRINKYLNCEELDTSNVSRDANKTHAVIVDNGTFSWGKNQEPVLKDINWTVKHCKLVAVVGEVGVGKSSLLSAILGDLEKINGSVNISGSLAYVPQQAWILNETVRENILFSKKLDKNKYKQVLDACALESDLMILEGGDMCEIGEKGINLSGGQKQRVSLARAVYSDADIYLLDDPLSAVDSHVSKHLFDKVIGPKGMLKSKTRIIVTHRITILPQVDEIVVLKNGRISEQGTYSELLEKRGDFAEILVQHLDQEMEDVDDPQEIAVIEDLIETIKPTYERRRSCLSVSEDSFSVSVGRRGSWKMSSTASFTKPVVGRLIEEESSAVGSIKWFVYKEYFRSMGLKALIMIAVCYILSNSFNVSTSLWLTVWSNDAGDPSKSEDTVLRNSRLTIYSILGLGEILFVVIGTLYINLSCLRAAIYLHNEMLGKVLFAPMSFFDTTPLGRIQNRFTRDIDTADSTLNFNLRLYIVMLLRAIVTLLLISMETPLFILFIIPLAIAYNRIQNYYIITTRQLRRIESTTRSPIYTHLSETVNGTSCIRAYGVSGIFIRECYRRIDVHHSANYPSIVAARWLTVRLQFIGYIIVCLAAIFAVMSRGTLSAGIAGLTISYAMTMTGTLNFMVISSTELETNIVSVERCLEYNKVPVEAARRIESTKPTADWPDRGCIRFLNYSTSYREGLNLVLKGVNFVVNPGEKVGVVGRTGAGKSSLTLALFRIIEPREGTIFIDDVDITTIGLHDLRSRLTIIPQDPVLFSGTVRMNLDPSGEVKDDLHLWTALDLANLGNYVRSLEAGLDHLISEKGENLSIGQRQLLCLARAIIRKSKILVLDEATAAVDVETDSLIQKAIREEFKECTVLTIAHRLNTVLDYDKILVLQAGEVMEYDAPAKLLLNKHSLFYGMAKDAGLV